MTMLSYLKRATAVAAVLAIPVGVALAQGGKSSGSPPAYGYSAGGQQDRGQIDAGIRKMLSKATKAQSWKTPGGQARTPIVVDNQIHGLLWENVNLKALVGGAFWASPAGVNAELVNTQNCKVVGTIWLPRDNIVVGQVDPEHKTGGWTAAQVDPEHGISGWVAAQVDKEHGIGGWTAAQVDKEHGIGGWVAAQVDPQHGNCGW